MNCMLKATSIKTLLGLTLLIAVWPDSSLFGQANNPAQGKDSLTKIKDLDGRFEFTPPATKEAWEVRANQVRTQLKIALGIHPMPQLAPLKPIVHSRRSMDGYSVEKVILESLPGLYITATLYRPDPNVSIGKSVEGKQPAMLVAHGHWTNARFYDALPNEVKRLLATGEERFETAARNHLQAKCVQLARMGCIVFQYDMLGNADSQQISLERAHGFKGKGPGEETNAEGWVLFSPEAEGYSQSVMGIQTIHSIRSLDFLLSLPEVDPKRIGITGASGGGTQSFIAAAVDPRIALSFPAVMVSTGMQGGCTCENASGLRVDTGNVEIAALFAPRPQGMTAADDWTRNMAKDGFPDLKKLYGLYDAADKVALFPSVHYGHNYNHVSRVSMYGWVNKHFGLGGEEPILERDFEFLGKKDLTVWDAEHPQPAGGLNLERKILRAWGEDARRQILEGDTKQVLARLQEGWDSLCAPAHHLATSLVVTQDQVTQDGGAVAKFATTGPTDGPICVLVGSVSDSLQKGSEGLARIEFSFVGEEPTEPQKLVANPRRSASYTYGYNPPRLVRRAAILAHFVEQLAKSSNRPIQLIGESENVFVASVAARRVPDRVQKLTLKPNGFRLANAKDIDDPVLVPSSLRFFDWPGLLATCETTELRIESDRAKLPPEWATLSGKGLLGKASYVK